MLSTLCKFPQNTEDYIPAHAKKKNKKSNSYRTFNVRMHRLRDKLHDCISCYCTTNPQSQIKQQHICELWNTFNHSLTSVFETLQLKAQHPHFIVHKFSTALSSLHARDTVLIIQIRQPDRTSSYHPPNQSSLFRFSSTNNETHFRVLSPTGVIPSS